ncbi:unnamed protein product [Menidia menidia]|uniref:(Atlantic silverside) hypothetical protein n=1 Tax=Menidia menidia TaxID=238744 RepID=A0A8S4BPV4_9TELE|nr:unnamed protein product [Menidia menidia]
MDSPYNGNASLQTSTSNLNASYSRPSEAEDDGKVSSDTIWLWIAVLATIGNIVVVAVSSFVICGRGTSDHSLPPVAVCLKKLDYQQQCSSESY